MEISEVRIKLVGNPNDRLKAFCTITFDDVFVVRDLKIVDGGNGLFVAMPSRRVLTPCASCRHKNPSRSRFCNGCGAPLPEEPVPADGDARGRLHRDIAHPINSDFRKIVQDRVLEAFAAECPPETTDAPNEVEEPVSEGQREAPEAPEEPEEPEEREDEAVSEYGSLIADLRGGPAGPRGRAPAPRGRESGLPRSGDDRARRGGTDRGRVESGERRARRDRVEPPAPAPRGPRREPERVAARTEAGRETAETRPATPTPRRAEVTPQPADDAAGGFGMGILSAESTASRPQPGDAGRTEPAPPSVGSAAPRDTTPPPPPRERATPEEATEPAPPDPTPSSSDDEEAFGAGLL